EELKTVFARFATFKNEQIALDQALRRFKHLDAIPRSSNLRFLGYVGIIESLVTHMPDPKDPNDSLTRQVRTKMKLIGRRCTELPIRYDLFDLKASHDKVWKTLYEYRSFIAHGKPIAFKRQFPILNSPDAARDFIQSAAASVLRFALD